MLRVLGFLGYPAVRRGMDVYEFRVEEDWDVLSFAMLFIRYFLCYATRQCATLYTILCYILCCTVQYTLYHTPYTYCILEKG